jgi:hypothetical protein
MKAVLMSSRATLGIAVPLAICLAWSPAWAANGGPSKAKENAIGGQRTAVPAAATVKAPPVATLIPAVTYEGAKVTGTLTATDPQNSLLDFSISSPPAYGTATVTDKVQGTFTYMPAPGFLGLDTFGYSAEDQLFLSGAGTVSVSVLPIPVTEGETVYVYAGETITGSLPAADAGNAALSGSISTASTAGTATVTGTGFSYQANSGGQGPDQFAYTVNNGLITSPPATITVVVSSTGPSSSTEPPIASNLSLPVFQDESVTGSFLASSSTGKALIYSVVAKPVNGTLTTDGTGNFTYTPAAGYIGADKFTYQSSDGTFTSGVATVNVDVLALDKQPPVNKGGGGVFWLGSLVLIASAVGIRRRRRLILEPGSSEK